MNSSDARGLRQYRQAMGLFLCGQIGFYLLLIVCIFLRPQGLFANDGFSYYGDYAQTILLYRLAFIVTGLLTFLSSWFLPKAMPFIAIKFVFRIMPVLLLGVVVTTAPGHTKLDIVHVGIGMTLFVVQLLTACWLALFIYKDRFNQWLLILLLFSGLISLIALEGIISYLLEGQILFQLAFGALMMHTLIGLRSNIRFDEGR